MNTENTLGLRTRPPHSWLRVATHSQGPLSLKTVVLSPALMRQQDDGEFLVSLVYLTDSNLVLSREGGRKRQLAVRRKGTLCCISGSELNIVYPKSYHLHTIDN